MKTKYDWSNDNSKCIISFNQLEVIMCSVSGCESKTIAKGMCEAHYRKMRKYGDPLFKKHTRHGMRYTKVYKCWSHIRDRCNNKNNKAYKYYGGRGISVFPNWNDSFEEFYKHVGDPPSEKHQIDRIDNNGNYEPKNVRWVVPSLNVQNRNINKLSYVDIFEIRDSKMKPSEISKKYNISYQHAKRVLEGLSWANVFIGFNSELNENWQDSLEERP